MLYARCCNNNKADTVLSLFEQAVSERGLPSRVRSDYGMENYHVGAYMIQHRGGNRGSILTGSSVHNTRVERAHRDIFSGVLVFYSRIFEELEYEELLDIEDDVHLFCLHYVYTNRINRSLNEFMLQMNHHPVSTERNLSPLQMWEKGMLEALRFPEATVLQTPEDLDSFGIDTDGQYSVDDEDYQVDVSPPNLNLPVECYEMLPSWDENDGLSGKDLFQRCVDIVIQCLENQN